MTIANWGVHSLRGFVESHVSDYETYFDALYEYSKNLEEAGAQIIRMEFCYEENRVLVYGDGKGLDSDGLNSIRNGIGKSSKGTTHHGLGVLAFMRFAKKMIMFSKKEGVVYVLSCMGDNDEVVSDTGEARPIGSDEEQIYRNVLYKLEKWPEATITVLEGVGKYKSDRFNFTFDMSKEFEAKKFERWFRDKIGFGLRSRSYFVKYGSNTPKRIEGKVAHGKRLTFKIPSKEYAAENIPGMHRNTFEQDGRFFSLELTCEVYVSPSNDAVIRISEGHQNSLDIRDAFKSYKLSHTSVYKNVDYLKMLSGLIDFKIKPLDEGPSLNVYSGTRRTLMTEGPFGDCLANMLNFADREIIRPVIESYAEKNKSRKDEIRSRDLQYDMEFLIRDNPIFFDDLIQTKNEDPVSDKNYVQCFRCNNTGIPKRGLLADLDIKPGNIYAPDDRPVYICGNCTKEWKRRAFTRENYDEGEGLTGGPKPMYERSSGTDGKGTVPRKQKRGYGFSIQIQAFAKSDNDRRGYMVGTIIKVNRGHLSYRAIEETKNRDALGLYERQVALETLIRYELRENNNKDVYSKKLGDGLAIVIEWFYTKRKRVTVSEAEEARELDEVVSSVEDLGSHWGVAVKKGKK